MIQTAIKRPFRAYGKATSIAFGFTMAGNIGVGLVNQNPPVSIYTYPQSFTTMALFKSLHAGILWPVLPIRVATGPKEFFVLGYSAKKAFDEIETEIQKQAEV